MRFTERGPAIPFDLLTARDRGEVVFFCGAGVSKPAGLLSFFELTVQVMRKLGVAPDSKIGLLMAKAISENDPEQAPPFDQVFGLLQRTYTPSRIEKEVTALLRTPRKAVTLHHQIVLRLSTGVEKRPFVVTTNFDHLFERALPRIKRWSPPMLPILTADHVPSGVVYLHGRLEPKSGGDRAGALVLGSGDFGRAYLADGWATGFMRQLLERRTVVLLGYSAGDPPIRYLLEGLMASTSANLQPIYAFDRGEPAEVESKWRDLGATGIAFGEFADLWQTLSKWADRADDPVAWRSQVLSMATQAPSKLLPFERGQVAAVASTPEGAKGFAESKPPPCAEWLCVLDRNIRRSAPFQIGFGVNAAEVDPLTHFGLDDEPVRSAEPDFRPSGIDHLAKLPADTDSDIQFRLAGMSPTRRGTVPRRLWYLSRWFEEIAHEPAAIWWASRQVSLHPDIVWGVNRRLTGHGTAFSDAEQRIWTLLIEISEDRADDFHDLAWFDFAGLLKRSGWSQALIRALGKAIKPRLKVNSYNSIPEWLYSPIPVQRPNCSDLITFKLHCPSRHNHDIPIPDNLVAQIVATLRDSLILAGGLLTDTGPQADFFHLPAIEPDDRSGERYVPRDGPESLFLWTVQLFKRLALFDPEAARLEVGLWPQKEKFFFDKMRVFAWSIENLFPVSNIANGILNLPVNSFLDSYLQRELLHLLRAKWGLFPQSARVKIEARLRRASRSDGRLTKSDRERFRLLAASRIGWLESQGCDLSIASKRFLEEIRKGTDWAPAWENGADRDMDGRAGWIARETSAYALKGISVRNVIAESTKLSGRETAEFVEYAPFDGLVEERPLFALAALAIEMREGRHPVKYWSLLLSNWPEDSNPRVTVLCGLRVSRLPQEIKVELGSDITRWIRDRLTKIAADYPDAFYSIWDACFQDIQSNPNATASGIGEVSIAGRVVQRSRKTLNHAINGPIGQLVESLLNLLRARKPKRADGVPHAIAGRLANALKSNGEGADHAATLLGYHLEYLYYVDAKWAKSIVVPVLDLTHPLSEAAWNGLLLNQRVPQPPELFALIKANFLNLFFSRKAWIESDKDERSAVNVLVVATYLGRKNKAYVRDEECRRVLQSIDDTGRQSALWTLHRIVSEANAWKSFGVRFFSTIWPQEARFQNGSATETMLRIAEDMPTEFPEVISVIRDFLRPTEHQDLFVYRQRRENEGDDKRSLAKMWPRDVLLVADKIMPLQPTYVPHELSGLLADLAEADPTIRDSASWRRLNDLASGT